MHMHKHMHQHPHDHAMHHPCHPWAAAGGAGGWRGGRRGRHGFGRGPRARRGDVRAALLVLLAEEPRNGYALMQEIEERSGGAWRPSPGSVDPALQQLEDEGLVITVDRDGRRVLELTEAGRALLAERGEHAVAPWDAVRQDGGTHPRQLLGLVREVAVAAAQVAESGDEAQAAQAREVLASARRSLYRILAEDPPRDDGPSEVREV